MKLLKKCLLFVMALFVVTSVIGCTFGGGTTNEGITFETNGGKTIPVLTDVEVGEKVTLPTPQKEGYIFAGWYATADFSSVKLPMSYQYNGPVTLYAKWMIGGYTITFESDEVKLATKQMSYSYNEELDLPAPTSDYYDFAGWYYEGQLFTQKTMPAADITLVAKWVGKKVTVKFDLNGGTAPTGFVSEVKNIEAGSTVTMPTPSKDGYLFGGWFDEAGKEYTSKSQILTDVTLVAKYNSLSDYQSTYNINYNLNGGTLPENTKDYYEVGYVTPLPTPTKANYYFMGWFESVIFYGDSVTEISNTKVGDITLYAKWKEIKNEYTVTFIYPDGTTSSKQVKNSETVDCPTLSQFGGMDVCWYLGNKPFNQNEPITEDLTLQANFSALKDRLEKMVPSVFFDNNDLPTSFNTNGKSISITWASSDRYTLSTKGVTNPMRVDAIVSLTATFKVSGVTITNTFDCIVPKVVFKDLTNTKPVFAYVYAGSHKGFTETAINTIDVVNLAFGRLNDDSTVNLRDVESKLETILQIRKTGTRVVLSMGGGGADLTKFSNTAATSENRKKFADSLMEIVERYHLDGVDIDWEYPGYNSPRPVEEDRPNFTLMIANITQKLKAANPDYIMSAALPGGKYGYERYQISALCKYFDYIHLMTYDFHDSSKAFHHTALRGSINTSDKSNVVDSVAIYMENGAPKEKLVIGVAFYGRVYELNGEPNNSKVIGSTNVTKSGGYMPYTTIYEYQVSKKATYYYDATACAPYIYIPSEKKIVSFDDANSIKAKCDYVFDKDLGGIMYWENGEDTTDTLLKALNKGMK